VDAPYDGFGSVCAGSWSAYKHPGDGAISTILSGTGTASLNYGNCFTRSTGTVKVYLNGTAISSAFSNAPISAVTFSFTNGDVLRIEESPSAIIKMNSLAISCLDSVCVNTYSTCKTCEAGKYKAAAGNDVTSCTPCTGFGGANPGYASAEGQTSCTPCDAHASNCSPADKGTCDAGYSASIIHISDFSTKSTMLASGWSSDCNFDVAINYLQWVSQCQSAISWAGFGAEGQDIGTVSRVLSGHGTATLNYGNCYGSGTVAVYLNGAAISSSAANTMSKEVVFTFTHGAILEIKETPAAIIKMNSFTIRSSPCVVCEAGKYKAAAGNVTCPPCTGFSGANPGYASTEGQTSCTPCDAHASNCSPTYRGTCNAGYTGSTASTCAACEAGKFKAAAGNDVECTLCTEGYTTAGGTFTGAVAQSECTSCAAGYFGASVGGTSGCSACPFGKFSLVDAATCTDCNGGYSTEQVATGMKHPCRCCAGGYHGSSVIGVNGCTICNQGKYSEPGNWKKCIRCPIGRYTIGAGTPGYNASACTICRSEYEMISIDGEGVCVPCPVGKHAEAGEICTGCERGRYMVLTYRSSCHFTEVCDAARTCPYCPVGKYGPHLHATSCQVCEAGKHMDRVGAQRGCEKCPAGTYSAKGADTCTQCPAGYFSAPNSSQCSICEAGTYAARKASSICTNCTAGTVSAEGARECSNCPAGRYAYDAAAACLICPAGRYSNERSTDCEYCPANTFSSIDSSACASCANGTFSVPGSSACE